VLTCELARSRAITIIAVTKNGEDPAGRRLALLPQRLADHLRDVVEIKAGFYHDQVRDR
jgi:hypothetical protein